MRGVLGFHGWDFTPQWEWFLKLTAMHMQGAQRDRSVFPGDSAQKVEINRRVHLEEFAAQCRAGQLSGFDIGGKKSDC